MKKMEDGIRLAVNLRGEVGMAFKALCAANRLTMNAVVDVWIRRCIKSGSLDDVWAQLKEEYEQKQEAKLS
jgi:hypothetical protein